MVLLFFFFSFNLTDLYGREKIVRNTSCQLSHSGVRVQQHRTALLTLQYPNNLPKAEA